MPSAGKGEDEADKPARKRAAGLLCPPVQRCGGCRNPSGARYERGEGQRPAATDFAVDHDFAEDLES